MDAKDWWAVNENQQTPLDMDKWPEIARKFPFTLGFPQDRKQDDNEFWAFQ